MLRVVYWPRERLIAFAEQVIGATRFGETAHAIGVERNGRLAAVVVYDRFTGSDCEVSIASDGSHAFASRTFLAHAAAYPFVQLRLDRVTAFVASGNRAALRWCLKYGFRPEGVKRHPDSRKSEVMLGLLRQECRWLP